MAFNFPKAIETETCLAIGRFVVHWSFIEASLDAWTTMIYQGAGGKHVEPEIPQKFSRKIKFLNLCFAQIDFLGSYEAEAKGMLEEASNISSMRHKIVHGYISDYDESRGVLTFSGFLPADKTKTMQRIVKFDAGIDELKDTGSATLTLANRMGTFGQRLLHDLVTNNYINPAN